MYIELDVDTTDGIESTMSQEFNLCVEIGSADPLSYYLKNADGTTITNADGTGILTK